MGIDKYIAKDRRSLVLEKDVTLCNGDEMGCSSDGKSTGLINQRSRVQPSSPQPKKHCSGCRWEFYDEDQNSYCAKNGNGFHMKKLNGIEAETCNDYEELGERLHYSE